MDPPASRRAHLLKVSGGVGTVLCSGRLASWGPSERAHRCRRDDGFLLQLRNYNSRSAAQKSVIEGRSYPRARLQWQIGKALS